MVIELKILMQRSGDSIDERIQSISLGVIWCEFFPQFDDCAGLSVLPKADSKTLKQTKETASPTIEDLALFTGQFAVLAD